MSDYHEQKAPSEAHSASMLPSPLHALPSRPRAHSMPSEMQKKQTDTVKPRGKREDKGKASTSRATSPTTKSSTKAKPKPKDNFGKLISSMIRNQHAVDALTSPNRSLPPSISSSFLNATPELAVSPGDQKKDEEKNTSDPQHEDEHEVEEREKNGTNNELGNPPIDVDLDHRAPSPSPSLVDDTNMDDPNDAQEHHKKVLRDAFLTPQKDGFPTTKEPDCTSNNEFRAPLPPNPISPWALIVNPSFKAHGVLPTGFPESRDLNKDVQTGKILVRGQSRFSKVEIFTTVPLVCHDTSPLPPPNLLASLNPAPQILIYGDGMAYPGFLRSFSLADMPTLEWNKFAGLTVFMIHHSTLTKPS